MSLLDLDLCKQINSVRLMIVFFFKSNRIYDRRKDIFNFVLILMPHISRTKMSLYLNDFFSHTIKEEGMGNNEAK